ncbi:MAG TPA: phosphatase PAP2 family protein [Sphingobacteriaceae bacterium]
MQVRFSALLKQHRVFLILYLLLLIGAFIALATFSKRDLFLLINNYYSDLFDLFFIAYTWVGDGLTMLLVAAGLLFVKYRYAILTVLAYGYTAIFSQVPKRIFNEPRPVKYFEGMEEIRTIPGLDTHHWNSFPSGHSVTAFALATVIAFLIPCRYKNQTWILVLMAALAAFSRVYLSQHFVMDAVVGSVIGVFLTFHLIYMLLNSKWYHSEKLEGRIFGSSK